MIFYKLLRGNFNSINSCALSAIDSAIYNQWSFFILFWKYFTYQAHYFLSVIFCFIAIICEAYFLNYNDVTKVDRT